MGGKSPPLMTTSRGDVYVDGVMFNNSFIPLSKVTDGTSTTIAIGESVHPHPFGIGPGYGTSVGGPSYWYDGGGVVISGSQQIASNDRLLLGTKHAINTQLPTAWPGFAALANDLPFGSEHPGGGAHFAYCDGHVAFLNDMIDFTVYQNLSTRAGAEIISESY